jgi:hypothetical protein
MKIAPSLFEAFLNCPTHCWLRATGELPSGNAYAEWVQVERDIHAFAESRRGRRRRFPTREPQALPAAALVEP